MTDVSVITVNYNTSEDTIKFVNSVIEKTKEITYEIIVIDNNSTWEEYNKLCLNLPKQNNIQLIRSVINVGFGAGNMLGVQKAKGAYLAFINNDTELIDNCLAELKHFIENTNGVGYVGPKMLNKDRNFMQRIYNHHTLFVQMFGIRMYEKFYKKPNPLIDYDSPIKVDWVSGAFMFFKTDVFAKIGGFDTNLFLFYEEMDLALRLKKIGLSIYYYPHCNYIHYAGVSTTKQDKTSLTKECELQISYNYVFRKHYGWFQHCLMNMVKAIKLFYKAFIYPKKWNLFWLHLQGSPLSESIKNKQKIRFINE